MTSSQLSILLIQSIVLNLSLFQKTTSKDAVSSDGEKTSVLDLIYNNRDLFHIKIYLIKIVMDFINCYSIIDVV